MISSMPRERSFFKRTVKSPVFASVTAARPICRPVRREVMDTSGMPPQNLIHVVEDAGGFGQGGSCGSKVIQHKCTLIHWGQEIRAEALITEVAGDDEHNTDRYQGERAFKRPFERTLVIVEQPAEGVSTSLPNTGQKSPPLFVFSGAFRQRGTPGEPSCPAGARAPE